jgi:Na+-transporting NADH:ubiquinone oxidoreductase subunit NqrD
MEVILTTTITDVFSGVVSVFVLHIIQLCPLLKRFTASLANNRPLSIGGEICVFGGGHGYGWTSVVMTGV